MSKSKCVALRLVPTRGRAHYDINPAFSVLSMSRKYQVVRDRIPLPGGGFVEAVRLALLDMSCFGDTGRLDLTGYPHESEDAAMFSDWSALGVDFKEAIEKVQLSIEAKGEGERDGQTARRPEAAAEE